MSSSKKVLPVFVLSAAALLAAAFIAGLAGCSSTEGDTASGASEATATAAVVSPYASIEVTAPELPYREYRLAENCHVEDVCDRYALLFESALDREMESVRMLDFQSGKSAVVVPGAASWDAGYLIMGAACSDGWIAWEEMSGDEYGDPLDVRWRIYAAPIDQRSLAVGESVLVTQSVASVWSRPLLQVEDDTLYWMNNTHPSSRQESVAFRSRIVSYDLGSGRAAEVYSDVHMTHAYCVQGDEIILARSVDNSTVAMEGVVVGLTDRKERLCVDLQNRSQLAHWPAHRDGRLAWSAEVSESKPYPALHLREATGSRYLLSEAGCDPTFVGDKLVYEACVLDAPASLPWPSIEVLDPETHERYTLIKTSGAMGGISWALPPGRPWSESSLVVFGHILGTDVEGSGLYVRRYELP